MITKEKIYQIYGIRKPSEKTEELCEYICEFAGKYGVQGILREAMFLAQIGHESGRLKYLEEIASGEAYEGRKDLGNVYPGDGKRYKGRGLIQITGRTNYAKVTKALHEDFVVHPELLAIPKYAVQSAYWYWDEHNLNHYADHDDLIGCTKKINGGLNGYEDRRKLYVSAINILDKHIV